MLPNASYRTAAVITQVLFSLLLVRDPTVMSAFWTMLVAPFGISHFSLQRGNTVQLEIWNWNFKALNRKKLQNWECTTEEHQTTKLLPVSHRILFCALHQNINDCPLLPNISQQQTKGMHLWCIFSYSISEEETKSYSCKGKKKCRFYNTVTDWITERWRNAKVYT